jgi:trigger factor
MKSIQKIELPEINDEFAKNLGNFKSVNHLKQNIKEGILSEKENQERQRIHQEIIEKTSQNSQFDVPEILIAGEKKRLLEELKKEISQNLKISFQDYLSKIKKSEKDLEDSLLVRAGKRVKNYLILREIGKRENIEVSEEEIKTRINEYLRHYPDTETAQKDLDLKTFQEYTEEAIRNEKTFKLLEKMCL